MNLTERDTEIINYIESVKGATIEQIYKLYFPSYTRASVRLKQLSDYGFLKCKLHPTIGKITYYNDKIPSFHDLVVNDILIALKGLYNDKDYEVMPKLGKTRPDLAIKLKNGRYAIFEIELFNKVKKEKLSRMHKELADVKHDIWIVSKWQSNSKIGRVGITELHRIRNYYYINNK
ncbi:MAG: hypothetical protein AB9836_05905 [Aminipila sp.]